uniref:F-box domain-containing protein n=1 Tax=Cannabis sativa TaxID=3483 RepID=A0A803PS45_CANSA
MPKVDNSGDFIFWFAEEISIKILTYLDDPSDVVRVSSVSKLWRQFVIEHDICKQLCLKKFPEISGAVELNNLIEPVDIGLRNGTEFELLKRNHKIFSFLAKALSPVITNDCLSTAISASSTDNYPTESIVHTLQPGDRNQNVASYWSSSGQHEPSVPETLLYELVTKMCLVSEIHVQPFQAYFQHRYPIYSCKAVRFKMGHLRNLGESDTDFSDNESEDHTLLDDRFVWTYISPEFPMVQESFLQKFELPEPALCVGGYLLVELLGRVQKQEIDDLYYICIAHVQIVGRPLLPTFDVEMHEPSGKCLLKHYSETEIE